MDAQSTLRALEQPLADTPGTKSREAWQTSSQSGSRP
jgi:hypothetical protein